MENENIQQPTDNFTPTPVEPQIQPTPSSIPSQKRLLLPFLAAILLLIFVASGAYYLGTQNNKNTPELNPANLPPSSTQVSEPTVTTPTVNPQIQTVDETKDWNAQKVLGLEFKLPNYLSQMDYPNGYETAGETGTQFCAQYLKSNIVSLLVKRVYAGGGACAPNFFGLGTTSTDFQSGRMGGFGDSQGYVIEEGKYFAKMPQNKKYEIPSELVEEITNSNGIKILRVIGRTNAPSAPDMPAWPVIGTPGEGSIGALINFDNNSTYSGIAIEMKLDEKLDAELFDTILSTFKFAN